MSLRWLSAMAAGVLASVAGCAQCETCADFPPAPPFAYEEGMVAAPPLRYSPTGAGPVMMMETPGMPGTPAATGSPSTPATAPAPAGNGEAKADGDKESGTPPAPTTPVQPPATLPLTPPSSGLESPPELPMPNLDNPTAMIVPIP